jgi:hypothetical protein
MAFCIRMHKGLHHHHVTSPTWSVTCLATSSCRLCRISFQCISRAMSDRWWKYFEMSVNRPGIFICDATSFRSSSSDQGLFKLGSSCACPKEKRNFEPRFRIYNSTLACPRAPGFFSSFLCWVSVCHKGNESTSAGNNNPSSLLTNGHVIILRGSRTVEK